MKMRKFTLADIFMVIGIELGMHELKGRVHCFSMRVVMDKSFLLNPDWRRYVLSFSRKT